MENEINEEIKQESIIENKYKVTKKIYLEWSKKIKRIYILEYFGLSF